MIVNNSILLDNDVAIGVAGNLVTPRDIHVLGKSDENRVVSDALTFSVQSTTCVASVGYRLIAKSNEVEVLKTQLAAERSLVEECQGVIIGRSNKLTPFLHLLKRTRLPLLNALLVTVWRPSAYKPTTLWWPIFIILMT